MCIEVRSGSILLQAFDSDSIQNEEGLQWLKRMYSTPGIRSTDGIVSERHSPRASGDKN